MIMMVMHGKSDSGCSGSSDGIVVIIFTFMIYYIFTLILFTNKYSFW